MGKGDKKTRRGKIVTGSYGVRRKKNNKKGKKSAAQKPAAAPPEINSTLIKQPEIKPTAPVETEALPVVEAVKEVKISEEKEKKTVRKKAAAKPKEKKEEKSLESEKTN